ncbi:hypothetical protein [Streptomyces sp. NBC_01477]|uniref:hypothetical protein n=1 Tax=Streptomyces sp. NBC_01477 TaxID=2976015 RepID=UPI002E365D30|nr:hypothetical protein [Streptomyces sp. NBC_01477]
MKRRYIALLGLVAAGMYVSSGTSWSYDAKTWTDDFSGYAYWTENGDSMQVCDDAADGYGVRGYIYTPNVSDPINGTVLFKGDDPSSNGTCETYSKDINETGHIGIKVCNYSGATVIRCGYHLIR